MRKWNKFLALLLAMVMAFSLTITAFAEGEDAETTETPSVEETEGESVEYNGTIVSCIPTMSMAPSMVMPRSLL